ncbi:MAG TPA: MmgE/PrpD family protein [Nitrolancea sp.]|nr:MmgE/PrpD family protein [Nitrolancea sp.]
MTLTTQLAAFVANTRFDDLPAEAVTMARRSLLDWIGSALRGGSVEPARIARGVAERSMAGSRATVLATGQHLSALGAAFANGAASHVIELDDLHQGSTFHPAAPIIPAALAIAEREGSSGAELLRAIVLGYDVAIRIAEAVNPSHYRYWHPTGTCGVFGSATAVGVLLGLNEEQLMQALGSAGTQASGLWQFLADGAMSKALHTAHAAHDGIIAAELARDGFTAASAILEGPRGFFAATAETADETRITDRLGTHFKIVENGFKRHACCGHTHTAIDAALELRPSLDGQSIEQVEIDTYRVALDITDRVDPHTPYEAKFSIQYAVATGLLEGRAGLEDFTDEHIADREIQRLLRRTEAREQPAFTANYPGAWASTVRVTLNDGSHHEATVQHPKGMPANPMNDAEIEQKFHDLVDGVVGVDAAGAIIAEMSRLSEESPVQQLVTAITSRTGAPVASGSH